MWSLRRPRRAVLATFAAVAAPGLLACGDGGPPTELGGVGDPVEVVASAETLEFLALEDSTRLTARVLDQGGREVEGESVTWASTDDSVAVVRESGWVVAVANGEAEVVARAGQLGDTVAVRVRQVAASLLVTPSRVVLGQGGSEALSAEPVDGNGHALAGEAREGLVLEWASDDETIATVDGNGLVTAVGWGGEANIMAAVEGASGGATVEVLDQLAYIVEPFSIGFPSALYRANADGTGVTQLSHPSPSESDWGPAWSPDGTALAFVRGLDGQRREIFVMGEDGGDPVNLTNNPAHDVDPAWSPDGTRIAFSSERGGEYHVFVMNADGSGLVQLTDSPGFLPAWSPDGTRIAYVKNLGTGDEIFVIDADGGVPLPLTVTAQDIDPIAWAPDGTKIAFAPGGGPGSDIHVIDADGSGAAVKLTSDPDAADRFPAWSPDGSRIAFQRERNGGADIYVMNADGSGVFNLTQSDTYARFPVWSPDGGRIAYWNEESDFGRSEIHVVRVDGTDGPTPVTNTGERALLPAWRPRPSRLRRNRKAMERAGRDPA